RELWTLIDERGEYGLAIGALLCTVPIAASADGQSQTPTPEDLKLANQRFREALALIDKNDFAGAAPKLREAMKLNPTNDVAVNLGQVEYRLGKYPDSAEHLAYALRNWPLVSDKAARERAEKRLREVRDLVGSLSVTASVNGADIAVDGKVIGHAPL